MRNCKNISIIICRNNKYEYLTGEEILPSNQSRVIKQATFPYLLREKLMKNKSFKTKEKSTRTKIN